MREPSVVLVFDPRSSLKITSRCEVISILVVKGFTEGIRILKSPLHLWIHFFSCKHDQKRLTIFRQELYLKIRYTTNRTRIY
jgi:hypothetical protein